jgi:hypothetical protein
MSNFALRLPDSLFERARILAERDNCSLNQLFAVAIAEKIATIDAEAYFAERTARAAANPGGMMRAINVAWKHNANTPPIAGDELPSSAVYRVQQDRATYVVTKAPAKVAVKRKG